jgi:hypothetical protein
MSDESLQTSERHNAFPTRVIKGSVIWNMGVRHFAHQRSDSSLCCFGRFLWLLANIAQPTDGIVHKFAVHHLVLGTMEIINVLGQVLSNVLHASRKLSRHAIPYS